MIKEVEFVPTTVSENVWQLMSDIECLRIKQPCGTEVSNPKHAANAGHAGKNICKFTDIMYTPWYLSSLLHQVQLPFQLTAI